MKIVIFGMGYVGLVSAACLSSDGHSVVGVDISEFKVDQINKGNSPIIEAGVSERLVEAGKLGRLMATTDGQAALVDADLAIVCVGTPTDAIGGANTAAVEAVVREVAEATRALGRIVPVVIRSTVPVGTLEGKLVPIYREAAAHVFGSPPLLFHPEFLREGTAVADYYDPPRIVIGEPEPASLAGNRLMELYTGFNAPTFRVSYGEAELLKYCDNVFHALKIAFANEVGLLARAHEVDSRALMNMFCADTKLNISPKYLRPGFAFGGSCLPKDLRGFLVMARETGLDLPLVTSIAQSNRRLIERAAEDILSRNVSKIGFYGLAFKPNTDDLRESPFVLLAETLLGKGKELIIVDRSVDEAKLIGGNEAYVSQHLPHLAQLVSAKESDLDTCDLIVVGHQVPPDWIRAWLEAGRLVYDLDGTRPRPAHPAYDSLT
jgi:GDP-mannose 6-dehydrogenase